MPKLNSLYPSKWLTSSDLDEDGLTLTIKSIEVEKMGDGVDKPVLYFDEQAKGLVCNKTNAKTIEKLYGDDTDDWIGERIHIFPTQVDFKGEQVEAIRVRNKKPKKAENPVEVTAKKSGKKAAAPMTQQEVDELVPLDDTPF